MKLASCDFCPKSKAKPRGDCLTTQIDERVYDICPECQAARELRLQGKGVAVTQPGTLRISWPMSPLDSTALQPPYTITSNPGSVFNGDRPTPFISSGN